MDTNASYLLRWRGRQQGPFKFSQIERKLAENEIGMLHEIMVEGEWVTLKFCFKQIDDEIRAEAERAAAASAFSKPPAEPFHASNEKTKNEENSFSDRGQVDNIRLAVGDCIKRAWYLTIRNPVETIVGFLMCSFIAGILVALYYGVCLWSLTSRAVSLQSHNNLVFILSIICSIAIWLAYNIVLGALLGGLWYLFIRVARGEGGGLGDLFAGFKRRMLQLALGLFFSSLILMFVPLLPLIIYGEIFTLFGLMTGSISSVSSMAGETSMFFTGLFGWVGLIIAGIVSLTLFSYYFTTRFIFIAPLIIDRQIVFTNAMTISTRYVSRQFWSVFGLVLLVGMIAMSGSLLCGVGIIFTMPLAFMSLAVAYSVIFSSPEEVLRNNDGKALIKTSTNSNALGWVLGIGLAILLLLSLTIATLTYVRTHGGSKMHSSHPIQNGILLNSALASSRSDSGNAGQPPVSDIMPPNGESTGSASSLPLLRSIVFSDALNTIEISILSIMNGDEAVKAERIWDIKVESQGKLGNKLVYYEILMKNIQHTGALKVRQTDFSLEDDKGNSYQCEQTTDRINGDIDLGKTTRGGISFAIPKEATPHKLIYQTDSESPGVPLKVSTILP